MWLKALDLINHMAVVNRVSRSNTTVALLCSALVLRTHFPFCIYRLETMRYETEFFFLAQSTFRTQTFCFRIFKIQC